MRFKSRSYMQERGDEDFLHGMHICISNFYEYRLLIFPYPRTLYDMHAVSWLLP